MTSEYGRAYSIETRRAGANLEGDHAAASTTLSVTYGFMFDEDGGQCEVEGVILTYTSATFPPDDDDDIPVVLHLDGTLGVDALDGAFVAVPDSEDTYATVEVTGEGVPIVALVDHTLVPYLSDGIRGNANESVTVLVTQDTFGEWRVVDVPGKPPSMDAGYLDPETSVPIDTIPIDEIELPAGQLTDGQLRAKVSVASQFWCAEYASDDPEETEPSETSSITKITSDIGFQFLQPYYTAAELATIRETDPDFDQEFREVVLFPNQAFDNDGNRLSAVFRGRVEAEDIVILRKFTIQGDAANGEVSNIAPGAKLQLDNLIADPDAPPSVTFAPLQSRWPGLPSNYEEIGWGVDGDFVVQGRVHKVSGLWHVQARYIDPSTGALDHVTDIGSIAGLDGGAAGFTAVAGRLFVLGGNASYKFIAAYDAVTGSLLDSSGPLSMVVGSGKAALGRNEDDNTTDLVNLVWRDGNDRVRFTSYNANDLASGPWTSTKTTDIVTSKPLTGMTDTGSTKYICASNEIFVTQSDGTQYADWHWWSRVGYLTAFGLLPGTTDEFVGTNKSGTLYRYNPDRPDSAEDLLTRWSKYNSGTDQETAVSPFVGLAWPTRSYATITVGAGVAPGTDDVRIYAWAHQDNAGYVRVTKPLGDTTVTIGNASGTVVSPPSTSDFSDADNPGCIESELEIAPGTKMLRVCGDGNAELYGLKIPFVYYYRASGLNVPHASPTQPAIGTPVEEHPCITYVPGGSFTINWPGLYRVEAHFTFEAGGGYRTGSILKNGNDAVDDIQFAGGGSGNYTSVSPSKTMRLAVGDVITTTLYQNSTAPLGIFSGEDRAFITFERLGV